LSDALGVLKTNSKYLPDGFYAVTPYLTVKNPKEAIAFYKRAFGARERMLMPMPDGQVAHVEIQIADSIIMLGCGCPDHGGVSPQTLGGSPVSLALCVQSADNIFNQAVNAGATSKKPVENKFWGDRAGSLTDPFGHTWLLLAHVEDVPPDEMKKRMTQAFSTASAKS